jgi:hypothetical protein
VPADRPPRGPARRPIRRRADPIDERRRRLDRLWSLVLQRFRDAAERTGEQPAGNSPEEHDDQP